MPIGSNVTIAKARVLKRLSKNDSVLHKHMKWLKELEEEKRQLLERKKVEEKEKMERMRSFMKRDAEKQEKTGSDESESASRQREGQISAQSFSNASSSALPTASGKELTKPAWCRSETTQEASELDAETNLLSFVDGLDFDKYTQDLELQAIIGQLKERIKTLERENKKDQNKLQICLDSENAARRAESVNIGSESIVDILPPTVIEQEDEIDVDDTESIATSVMSESAVSSVHSKKSIKALVSKAKGRMLEMTIEEGDENKEEENQEREKAVPLPVLSTVTDDNGARLAEKKSINKLAFKNRNPAL